MYSTNRSSRGDYEDLPLLLINNDADGRHSQGACDGIFSSSVFFVIYFFKTLLLLLYSVNLVVRVKLTSRLELVHTLLLSRSRLVAGSFDISEVMSLVFYIFWSLYYFFLSKRRKKKYSCQPTRISLCLECDTLKGKTEERKDVLFCFLLANTDLPGFFPTACVCGFI